MKLATLHGRASRADYSRCVDFLLQRRYQTSIASQHAGDVVRAAWRAGYSPRECVEWLADVDGLS